MRNIKILYVWTCENKQDYISIKSDVESWGYDIKMIDSQHWLGVYKLSWKELDTLYQANDSKLLRFYTYIYRISKNYDVIIVGYGCPFHPEFIKSLKGRIYTVLHSGDDPQGSSNCSEPFVKYFDYSFCYGGVWDKSHSVIDKFKEWGAPKADRWVYGFRQDMYNPELTVSDIYNKERDIDVIIVTNPWKKEDKLSYIKSKIPNAKIYGKDYFGIMGGHILRTLKKGKLPNMGMVKLVFSDEVPQGELVKLYQRCKIGINIHLENIDSTHVFGCSGGNIRTTMLPANGVMQISGCQGGVKDIFEVGKEIVCFDSIEEAVGLAKYYLEHDDKRKTIAANGFKRAIKDYSCKTTFENALKKIVFEIEKEKRYTEHYNNTVDFLAHHAFVR